MIESAEAVSNLEAILQTAVSAIMVVPGDMSIDLGLGPAPGPENHPEVEETFTRVREICQAQDRVICGIGDGAARLQQRIDEGWGPRASARPRGRAATWPAGRGGPGT